MDEAEVRYLSALARMDDRLIGYRKYEAREALRKYHAAMGAAFFDQS